MDYLSKILLVLSFAASLGCGVKGRPMAPLNPAPIGRGEPTFKETEKKKPLKKASSYKDESDSEAEEP